MAPLKRAILLVVLIALGGVVVAWIAEGGPRHANADEGALARFPGAVPIDESAFAPGSCVAFDPTAGDRHLTVFLDAGHGGIDPGAVGTTQSGSTIYEADATLPVELDTMAILRSQGFRVIVSRTGDATVAALKAGDVSDGVLSLQGSHDDVVARDVCANDAGANLLLGIYFDAGQSSQDAGSVTLYDTARSFSSENQRFAELLQSDVLAAMNARSWQIPDVGVLPDNQFGSYVGNPSSGGIAGEAASYDHLLLIGPAQTGYFSNPSQMPGAVTEPLFVTDPFEGSIASSSTGQHVIAQGIATAVGQFFSTAAS